MRVPLCDLEPQHEAVVDETALAISRVVASQRFILGEEVSSFEQEFAAKIGASYAVGVGNGSDAIALSLLALGVGPGDGVVTTPYTFVATGSAIARIGAVPIFADVEANGVQLDAAAVADVIASATIPIRAIVVVHLFGFAADLTALEQVAKKNGIPIVEDAAQAYGTRIDGKSAGTFGAAGCFSFFPSKTLGAWGDAGAVVTGDAAVADRLKSLRAHGFDRARGYVGAGDNSRLDAIQAAVLRVKLRHVSGWIAARRKLVDVYRSHFLDKSDVIGSFVEMPEERAGEHATFNPLVIVAERRDELATHLHDGGIEARAYYTQLLSAEPRFASSPASSTPHAQAAANSRLALPLFFGMTRAQVDYVVEAIAAFYSS